MVVLSLIDNWGQRGLLALSNNQSWVQFQTLLIFSKIYELPDTYTDIQMFWHQTVVTWWTPVSVLSLTTLSLTLAELKCREKEREVDSNLAATVELRGLTKAQSKWGREGAREDRRDYLLIQSEDNPGEARDFFLAGADKTLAGLCHSASPAISRTAPLSSFNCCWSQQDRRALIKDGRRQTC